MKGRDGELTSFLNDVKKALRTLTVDIISVGLTTPRRRRSTIFYDLVRGHNNVGTQYCIRPCGVSCVQKQKR